MTNAAEPVSQKDAAQWCFTTWQWGYTLTLRIHPSRGYDGSMD